MRQPDTPRPLHWLKEYGKRYPGAWRALEAFALVRGKAPGADWPPYVYLPLEAALAYLFPHAPPAAVDPRVQDAARLTALAAWRVTKGIYRFAPELFEELWEAPFEGVIPLEPLRRLPEYAVYVETPGQQYGKHPLRGFFAFVTHDLKAKNDELYLVWDLDHVSDAGELEPYLFHTVVHLGQGMTLEEGLREATGEGLGHLPPEEEAALRRIVEEAGGRSFEEIVEGSIALNREYTARAVSLLFFLALSTDVVSKKHPEKRPERPRPVKTKRGLRIFAAPGPTEWEVGVRYADTLRRAYERSGTGAGTGRKKRPHIRRAHWHGYWVGPRKEPEKRRLELRWIPPILVGAKGEEIELEDIPAVIWRVRPRE